MSYLHRLARERDIQIRAHDIPRVNGIAIRIGSDEYIFIRHDLTERQTHYTIAHEIAHFMDDTIGVHHYLAERRADRIAHEVLIPHDRLREAIEDGYTEYGILASIFGVDEVVVERRVREIYQTEGRTKLGVEM